MHFVLNRCLLIYEEIRDIRRGFLVLSNWLLFALVFSHGLGHQLIFRFSTALLLGLLLQHHLLSEKNITSASVFKIVLCLFTAWLFWPIVYLYGFWAFVINDDSENGNIFWRANCIALLFFWLIQATFIGSWTLLPHIGIPLFLLTCFIAIFVPRRTRTILAIGCILLSLIQLTTIRENVQISYNPTLDSGYRHGAVLAKLLNGKLVDPNAVSGNVGITSLIQKSGENHAKYPIVLVDHDQIPSPTYPAVSKGNVTQTEPWYSNQLFGDQYLLAAIAEDCQWVSHLGGKLAAKGKLMLAMRTDQGIEPVVLQYGKTIYVNDSDAFVDRLANYQRCGIKEIVYGSAIYRSINIFFVLAMLLSRYKKSEILASIALLIFAIFYTTQPVPGDIRIIGKVCFPHEPSRVSGVMRSLVDAGFPYVRGTTDCTLLVVDGNQKAKVKSTERVVIGCDKAAILLGDNTIRIGEIPLGDINDVVDARNIIVNGKTQGANIRINDTIVIGTGSPAKQGWSKWLR